jgi:hypothetical protein
MARVLMEQHGDEGLSFPSGIVSGKSNCWSRYAWVWSGRFPGVRYGANDA